jgi:hypothetical protein
MLKLGVCNIGYYLKIGIWSLVIIWILGFGYWNFK